MIRIKQKRRNKVYNDNHNDIYMIIITFIITIRLDDCSN